nr:MAG TPA: hypothetical protein [Caudoviricetes sp.]
MSPCFWLNRAKKWHFGSFSECYTFCHFRKMKTIF